MNRTRFAPLLAALLLGLSVAPASAQQPRPAPELLLRLDDAGMSHAVNAAIRRVAATGIPFSVSVMPATPWFEEAVELLRAHPQISAGIHLTLNSEWSNLRWGPVLGREAVPSLVDSLGYFLPSTAEFLAHPYRLDEVERELDAQVRRALAAGLRLDYVDYHMGTAVSTPQLREVVERVAARHGLGVSRYFGEHYQTLFSTPIDRKQQELVSLARALPADGVTLMVIHVAEAHPEIAVLRDRNNAQQNTASGESLVGRHRNAELQALLSPEFQGLVRDGVVRLVTYADLMRRHGTAGMRRPR